MLSWHNSRYMSTPGEKKMIPIQLTLKVGTISRSFEVLHPTDQEPSGPLQYTNYNQKSAKGFGITQIIIGTVCTVLSSVLMGTNEDNIFPNSIGYGIWGGVLVGLVFFKYYDCLRISSVVDFPCVPKYSICRSSIWNLFIEFVFLKCDLKSYFALKLE